MWEAEPSALMPRREATRRAMGLEKRVRKPQKLPWADPARLALTHHLGSSIAAAAPTQRGHRTRSHSSCSPVTPGSGSPRSFPGAGGAPTSPPCHGAPPRDVTSLLPPPCCHLPHRSIRFLRRGAPGEGTVTFDGCGAPASRKPPQGHPTCSCLMRGRLWAPQGARTGMSPAAGET